MRAAFGALTAIILLGIFIFTVADATAIANCVTSQSCDTLDSTKFHVGKEFSLSLIGGLLAALVTAELAVTQPGQQPMARTFGLNENTLGNKRPRVNLIIKIVTALYLLTWLLTGLWTFIVGVLNHYQVLPPLTDFGQAWLGLAITSVYAYFGINPDSSSKPPTS